MNEKWVTDSIVDLKKRVREIGGGGGGGALPPNALIGIEPLQDVVIAPSAWSLQSKPEVAGYPYVAAVSYPGITTDHYAMVVFNQSDAISGKYATICKSETGVVCIYAKSAPSEDLLVATIIAMELSSTGDADPNIILGIEPLQGVRVEPSAWTLQPQPEVAGYPYVASIAYPGLTPDHYVMVVFSPIETASGNYANVCKSEYGAVQIYAKEQPDEKVTIATVIAMDVQEE